MRAWASHQLLEDQQANRAPARESHDQILLHGQSVRDGERTPACTDAAVGEEGEDRRGVELQPASVRSGNGL